MQEENPDWGAIMTSTATSRHGSGAGREYERGRGGGLVIFASVALAVLGFFNLLDGIAAISRSHVFAANAHYVVGDLRAWGWPARWARPSGTWRCKPACPVGPR